MGMTTTSTSVFPPDPRETALTRARALYPNATVAEQIAVAEYLLRQTTPPAPAYPVADQAPYPWRVTCGSTPPFAVGGFITTNPVPVTLGAGGAGGNAGSPSTVHTWTSWDQGDDGTAGVLARTG